MADRNQFFSIGGALKEGWELTKLNIGFLLVYQVIMYFFIWLFNYPLEKQHFIISVLGLIIQMLLLIGFFRSALLLTQGKRPSFDQLYMNWRLLPSWFIALIALFFLSITLPVLFITIVLPLLFISVTSILLHVFIAIVWFVSLFLFVGLFLFELTIFGFYPFFIVDKGLGPIKSLKRSAQITKKNRWRIFLLFLVCIGINLLGILFFLVGVLITVPLTLIAIATVYEKLTNQSEISIQPEDIFP